MTARAERSPRRRTTPGVECPPQGHRQRASQQAHRREREGTTALPLHDRHCTHARDGEGKAPSAGQQPAAAMREWGGIGRPGLLMTNGASPVGPSPDGTTAIGGPLVIERQPRAMTARAERSPRRRTTPGVECPPQGHQQQAYTAQATGWHHATAEHRPTALRRRPALQDLRGSTCSSRSSTRSSRRSSRRSRSSSRTRRTCCNTSSCT